MPRGNTIPKPPDQRRRRNKAPEQVEVAVDDEIRGFELPEGFDWPAPTRQWWEEWRRSPQAQTFTATDWSFLADTALLHAELWGGNGAVAGELRLRVAKFGATPEDRLRLRMTIVEPEAEGKPKAKPRYGHLRAVAP